MRRGVLTANNNNTVEEVSTLGRSAQQDKVDEYMSESESDESEEAQASEEEDSWIAWFCSLRGNEFFCEVEEEFIQDEFNLSGLSSQVPYYDYALDLILDIDSPNNEVLTDEQQELIESAAELLYGMIHARYILTSRGLQAMLDKYKNADFGRCPRVLCGGQPCLPTGTADIPRQNTVKIFCPKCEDIYFPRSKYQGNIDGAFFGTTFPHLLLLTYPMLRPPKAAETYVPKVFGFKIHNSAYAIRDQRTLAASNAQQQSQQQTALDTNAAKLADGKIGNGPAA